MLSRRDVIQKMAVGTAAAGAAVVAARGAFGAISPADNSTESSRGPEPRGQDSVNATAPSTESQPILDSDRLQTAEVAPVWSLIRPLTMGSLVANGWRVAGLTGVVDGSCVLTLQNERGRSHRIHICRNDGNPQGLVYTDRFDLLAMNGGQGDLPTEEGFARAVAKVARVLAKNERREEAIVTALLPQAERVRLFSGAIDRRLR
jgi:hypothetical protein